MLACAGPGGEVGLDALTTSSRARQLDRWWRVEGEKASASDMERQMNPYTTRIIGAMDANGRAISTLGSRWA
jgi:hypothetical protein